MAWKPNRLEQRSGRIHRIGQTEVCHVRKLLAEDTLEGRVYQALLDRAGSRHGGRGGAVGAGEWVG